ncbi:LapA family protein [Paenirhodobacter enshiensis]|uniref:LapA family protein n=1 Tax=Paenirhodobacter enshiensis TaxID=1105367 RepID=UPI001FE0B704|nr:LapA family protein [Paenirhodobacter enshiensis]
MTMIRLLRSLVLVLVALVLVVLALANRNIVELHLLPAAVGDFIGQDWTLRLPLFLVIFGGILAGVLLGFVWEWLRAHRTRASGQAAKKQLRKIERETAKAGATTDKPRDEVLALLDQSGR